MEIIGDNTCLTSEKPQGKIVYCHGEARKYWLELQFVDENNQPVTDLKVKLEYRPLATSDEMAISNESRFDYNPTPPPNPPVGVTDAQGIVRFDDLCWLTVDVKVEAQKLADEMEQRPLSISRNPESQPVSKNRSSVQTRHHEWRSNVQISAEQQGCVHHYVTIGELCDQVPDIPLWEEKSPPRFHFPPDKALKGTEIPREVLDQRHVIEICPFRAWSLILHDTKDYSLANGYNLGVMADMAYSADGDTVINQFFFEQCQDLSRTPRYEEFPSFPYALVVDVPFRERYIGAKFLESSGLADTSDYRPLLDSTELFYIESATHMVVSWRGTQEIPDWLTDASFAPAHCPTELASAGSIHGGFLAAYQLAKERFIDDFRIIKRKVNEGKKLYICGHSLGGALALAYAAEMKEFKPLLYTYGMPRTFTATAVGCLYQVTHYRHVNDADIITTVPFDAHLDNWLLGKYGPLGATLGFFWTLTVELPVQMAGAYVGEHYWHHGDPVVFFRATQTSAYEECRVIMNPNTCRRLSYTQPCTTKLFLVPSMATRENQEAKAAQEAFMQEFPREDIQSIFPRNTNPLMDHLPNPLRHSMASEYLPFLNNQLLESAWPELNLRRKRERESFRRQMDQYGASAPAEEVKRNNMFLALQGMLDGSLAKTHAQPGGDHSLVRFKSVAGEKVEH